MVPLCSNWGVTFLNLGIKEPMNKFDTACFTDHIDDKVAYFKEFGVTCDASNGYLKSVPFFLMSKYCKYLQPGGPSTKFNQGTDISDVITFYLFDKELKSLIMDAIQDIETSFKHVCIEYLYKKTQSSTSLKSEAWIREDKSIALYESFFIKVAKIENTIKEPFVPDHRIISEMSFGNMRRLYEMAHNDIRQGVESYYSMTSHKQFHALLASINSIRNKSAHYERVWNSDVESVFRVTSPRHALHPVLTQDKYDERKIYNTLAGMVYLLSKLNLESEWKRKFKKLLNKYEGYNYTKNMGFPEDWASLSFWLE